MLKTSVLVSALALVTVLLVGGVAAGDIAADPAEETVPSQQQQPIEVEVIVEDRNGERLSDIEVVASWGDGETASDTTTSQGRVLLDVPANQRVEFTVNDTDGEFVRNHQPRRVRPTTLDGPVTIQMALRGQIDFTVVDTDGNPIQDARLRLSHIDDPRTVEAAFTDADGTAVVSDIEQRTYSVAVRRAGYNITEATVELNSDSNTSTINIESHRVNVDFTVVDDHFEEPQPLEDVTIDIPKLGGSPIPTDANGQTQARLPVNDNYELTVVLDGYQETTTVLSLGQEPTEIELQTQRDPSISINQLQDAIVVGQPTQVTVTNAYEEPVENARVTLNGANVGRTDPNGQIVFNITQAGNNTIEASANGLTDSTTLEGVDPNADDEDDTDDGTDDSDDGTTDDGASDDGTTDDGTGDGTETDDDSGSADAIGPGFGLLAAAGGLLALALLARRAE
jgi:hypothetical protein